MAILGVVVAKQAGNEKTAGILGMMVEYERAMAHAIDTGQASGEVARRKDGTAFCYLARSAGKVVPVTFDDLGISSQRVAEWRRLRYAATLERIDKAIKDDAKGVVELAIL